MESTNEITNIEDIDAHQQRVCEKIKACNRSRARDVETLHNEMEDRGFSSADIETMKRLPISHGDMMQIIKRYPLK